MIDLDAIQPSYYEFTLKGKGYTVPSMDSLPAEMVLDLACKGDVTRSDLALLFNTVLKEYAPDALRLMSSAQLKAMLADWTKTGNVGESSPSSD